MPNRDYATRGKSSKGINKFLILLVIILLLLLSGLGLWVLNEMNTKSTSVQAKPEQKKIALPSRPEETYNYIRDLETREIPVDGQSKFAKLTKEQEQQILKRKEEEKRRLEQQAQQFQQAAAQNIEIVETPVAPTTEEQLAKQKEQEQAEEKRKQAELKKQQELAKKAEQIRLEVTKQAQEKQAVEKKVEAEKSQPAKVVATAKPASEAPKASGRFGLQCGAFKSKAQAENMQARLAMAGYNAKINSSADWNRVVVGPVGDRSAASAAQSNARSVAECLIVAM